MIRVDDFDVVNLCTALTALLLEIILNFKLARNDNRFLKTNDTIAKEKPLIIIDVSEN